ncbi:MAG: helix-turn-helix domain-containing protein [Chitinophagaceae bacterium]|nr:MAG: helix-turn-helix domain-containing protein [Chitinophagaceae bacterium]
MFFQFNRYSSILLIFFVHALVYAFLLFRKGAVNESRSDKWLAVFLLLCVLYISPWMLGFAGWYDTQPYRDLLFYIPFQQLYFIGPVIFFYIQALLNPAFRFTRKSLVHLVPGLVYLAWSLAVVITDQVVLDDYYFLAEGEDPDFETWYQLTGVASMLCYLVASLRYYQLFRTFIVQVTSNADNFVFRWIRNFLLAFLVMLVIRIVFFVAGFFTDLDYWSTWWYYLVFAIIFYYIAITGYANSIESGISFATRLVHYKPVFLLNVPDTGSEGEAAPPDTGLVPRLPDLLIGFETGTPASAQVAPATAELKGRIADLLAGEQVFRNPELSLAVLARKLNSNISMVSKAVNQGFGMNFNDLVNKHRIDAVIAALDAGGHKTQTLLGIAYDAGFNSKATFNRAFKKATGKSPKDYLAGAA